MKRVPVIATAIVIAAVATMIALGIWQLQRLGEKEAALTRLAAAQGQPPIAWPIALDRENPPLFRRSALRCDRVTGWRSESGRNLRGESGWVHIADCRSGAVAATVVAGWSERPEPPAWTGGQVRGVIAPDRARTIRLVAADPAPGLRAARPPAIDDIPNNHRFYAAQWFFFALAAAVIYVLALRRRRD